MKPAQLAHELKFLIGQACHTETVLRDLPPLTSHELAVLLGTTSRLLYKLRDEAIEREIDARNRIKAGGEL